MRNRATLLLLAFIVGLTAFSVAIVWPDQPERYLPGFIPWPSGTGLQVGGLDRESMRLGLDLKGGTHVLLEADTTTLPPGRDLDEEMDTLKRIIERRVNRFGVSEAEIQREGRDRLSVQLPGIDPEEAGELIGKTALLEFREPKLDEARNIVCQADDGSEFSVLPIQTSFDREAAVSTCIGNQGQSGQVVWEAAACRSDDCGDLLDRALTGAFLNDADQTVDITGPAVSLEFNRDGGRIFQDITTRLEGYPLGIFLDDELVSAPSVTAPITGGRSQITGLDVSEARILVAQLKEGRLPLETSRIQETEVDATLGDDTLRLSVQAGLIGVLAVMAFMILYYRLPGVLAALALAIYASTVLMLFKLGIPIIAPQGFTITLAGIAAFVLSVGMAVDANILIFERLKEELRGGRSLVAAIEVGFDRAWPSIRDSNVSTIITALILWWFGDQFNAPLVIGFAKILLVGVVVSMFSAITVTRTFLRLLVGTPVARNLWLFGAEAVPRRVGAVEAEAIPASPAGRPARPAGGPDGRPAGTGSGAPFMLDFVRRRGFYYLLSLLILLPGIVSLLVPPSLKPGIEFSSGATFTIGFQDETLEVDDVRDAFADLGHDEARVQRTSEGAFIVRTGGLSGVTASPPIGPAPRFERDVIEAGLIDRFGPLVNRQGEVTNSFQNFNSVSEIVSREIGRDAAIAVVAAAVAILLYITYSFRKIPKAYRYGIAALIAVAHDTLIILGAFSIFGKVFDTEINTMFITGLLTIIGFSVHDTIVVFDRIRENVARNPGVPFDEVVNASLTETMGRSLNTSTTLIFTILALLLLGGVTIQSFLLVLLIGVIAGTYSSIFVASQILISWEHDDIGRFLKRIFPRLAPAEA